MVLPLSLPTPVLLLDGGLGTTLEDDFGVRFSSDATPLWSSHLLISHSNTLLAAQAAFAAAPVDVIETATYQVSVEGFARVKTAEYPAGVRKNDIPPFLADAVGIAEAAAASGGGAAARIALALGPYGASMIPSQEYGGIYDADHSGVDALTAWHAERLELCASVDRMDERLEYVAFETVPRADELQAIRAAAEGGGLFDRGVETIPKFWISCVFPGEGDTLPDGSSVEDAIETMLGRHISGLIPWGVGINCTKVRKLSSLIERYEIAVSRMIEAKRLDKWPSLVLYPDGTNGELYNTTTQEWELPEGKAVSDAQVRLTMSHTLAFVYGCSLCLT